MEHAVDRTITPVDRRVVEGLVGVDPRHQDARPVAPQPADGDAVGSDDERGPEASRADEFAQLIQMWFEAAAAVIAAGIVMAG